MTNAFLLPKNSFSFNIIFNNNVPLINSLLESHFKLHCQALFLFPTKNKAVYSPLNGLIKV